MPASHQDLLQIPTRAVGINARKRMKPSSQNIKTPPAATVELVQLDMLPPACRAAQINNHLCSPSRYCRSSCWKMLQRGSSNSEAETQLSPCENIMVWVHRSRCLLKLETFGYGMHFCPFAKCVAATSLHPFSSLPISSSVPHEGLPSSNTRLFHLSPTSTFPHARPQLLHFPPCTFGH